MFHYDRSIKIGGHRPNNWLTRHLEPISTVVQTTQNNYIGEIEAVSTVGSRLLAEAAMFTLPVYTWAPARRGAQCIATEQIGR